MIVLDQSHRLIAPSVRLLSISSPRVTMTTVTERDRLGSSRISLVSACLISFILSSTFSISFVSLALFWPEETTPPPSEEKSSVQCQRDHMCLHLNENKRNTMIAERMDERTNEREKNLPSARIMISSTAPMLSTVDVRHRAERVYV